MVDQQKADYQCPRLIDLRFVEILREIEKLVSDVVTSPQIRRDSKDEVCVHHHP